jgi:hypothetical protein
VSKGKKALKEGKEIQAIMELVVQLEKRVLKGNVEKLVTLVIQDYKVLKVQLVL